MKHTGQPIEVIGMIPFSLEREEEAVVILQNIPCISNVDISTILILFSKPYAGSGEQQLSPSLENIYIQETLLVLASSLFWQSMRYYLVPTPIRNLEPQISFFVHACILVFIFYFNLTEKELERDKFLSADEAKDFGLVDRVLSHPPITESPLSNGDKVDS